MTDITETKAPAFDFVKNRGPVSMTFGKAISLPSGMGLYDLLEKIRLAAQEKIAASTDDWISLHEVYDDTAVCCRYSYDDGSTYFEMTWSINTAGEVELGEAKEVKPETTFVPVAKRYTAANPAPSVFGGLV